MPSPALDTSNWRFPSNAGHGKYAGEFITRVPTSHLRWMVNVRRRYWQVAAAELERRGAHLPKIDVTAHAIDRASLSCMSIFKRYQKDPREGLYSFLSREGLVALSCPQDRQGRHRHLGMLWLIETHGAWPVVKTVMRDKGRGFPAM